MKRSWLARHPVGFMALYSIFYLSVFHYLEANVPLRSILVHCRLDDLIPFCKYAVIPYFAWFVWIPFTLFYLLWKAPREDFWRLCLPLFSGMTLALACYAVLPTALDLRPYWVPGSDIFAQTVRFLYRTDTATNVCPSIHVFNSVTLLLAYYLFIPATNDKEWQPSWSRLPSVEINGNEIVVKDVRSFIYRTERDFDARYVTRRFDLDKLATLDFAVSHWDGMEFVAHTMLSFGFEDGKHMALSVETRLPEGVEQGSVPGLYKQFNVIYILADEEDLFALRTNYRKEDMYLYRINIGRENLKKAFLGFAEKINSLHERPRYYHTVTANCTTELVDTFKSYLGVRRWQWTPVFNGMCDQNAYDRGELLHLPGESFRELKKRSFLGHGGNGEDWPALRRRWEEGWRTFASAPVKE
jgi:hypothetical protein